MLRHGGSRPRKRFGARIFTPMSARFTRSANAVVRWTLVLLILSPLVVISSCMLWVRTPYSTGENQPLEQPVPFDHRHHVADDLIDCRYCHDTVERAASAGIPSADRCMGCHNQIWSDSPLLEPVRESYFEGRPIRWRRVHNLPDFVFFDHSVHVANGVGCETCHGRVDRMARIYQVAPLTMGWCLGCHRDPGPHLRPLEAITEMGWRPRSVRPGEGPTRVHAMEEPDERGGGTELGEIVAERLEVSPGTDCWTCHR